MKHLRLTGLVLVLLPLSLAAQTETGHQRISGNMGYAEPARSDKTLQGDTMHFHLPPIGPALTTPMVDYTKPLDISMPSMTGGAFIGPLSFVGSSQHYTGLMDMASGEIALRQQMGRFIFSASVMANKYWMPWQHNLTTQYGVGGSVGYRVSNAISLHAFGEYYATNPVLGPAFYPYVNTTTYGGYADIRDSNTFGSKVGVRRFMNPMTGKWTTEPIINPYVKIGRSKLEFPIGGILKSLIWGQEDNPLHFNNSRPSAPPSGGGGMPRPVQRPR